MTIHHVVRCDGPACTVEKPLIVSVGTMNLIGGILPGTNFAMPAEWKQIYGKAFCSWKCVVAYDGEQR